MIALVLLFAFLSAGPCAAQTPFVESLAARGLVEIPLDDARKLESELGQLLVVNVDGFGYSGPLALVPDFSPMIQRLNIGGVIPHYGSASYERIRRTNRALQQLGGPPLLICADIVRLRGQGRTGSFGDGYVGGFIGRFRRMSGTEFPTLARLNAFTLNAIGINVALGPTVDTSTADPRTADRARVVAVELRTYGLQVVLKHFPYLPTGADLHRQSPDTKVPATEAESRFSVFRGLATDADMIMTTHLLDSAVDREIVTFSPIWNAILRADTGFTGPLMSDGLLMLRNYPGRSAPGGGAFSADFAGLDPTAVWAARAILAGHDLLVVEGSAAQTVRVFDGLLTAACRASPEARELRRRIEESSSRIARWKQEREAALRRTVEVPPAVIQRVIALLPADGTDLASFRFDPAGIAGLQSTLDAARFIQQPAR
ncbi:MAG: glycoside hydrolase family 3 N-terminal domain-containing protein [Spirochaetia bacterium]